MASDCKLLQRVEADFSSMIRMLFRVVLRHGVPPISREEESSNIVSKLNRSQSHRALTLGHRCLDEQPCSRVQCFVTHHDSISSVSGRRPCDCKVTACASMR
jgi:hypothetical protein